MSKLSQFFGGGGGGGFGGGMPTIIASTDQVVESNTSVGINTSEGQVTVTLPSSPDAGDRILFFDAALTWDKYPAIIDTGGNRVEQDVVELTSYTLHGKGGVQELLYIGEGYGWVDASFYVTSVDPVWYGSDVLGRYIALSKGQVSTTELEVFTASRDYTISEDGYYCIEVAAGTSGTAANTTAYGDIGGTSKLTVNGSLLLESLSERYYTSGVIDVLNKGKLHSPIVSLTQIGFIDPSIFMMHEDIASGTTVNFLNDARELGINPIVTPGSSTSSTPLFFTPSIEASSILLPLKAGDNLVFEIGAAGAKHPGSGRPGNAGKARLHLIQGLPL